MSKKSDLKERKLYLIKELKEKTGFVFPLKTYVNKLERLNRDCDKWHAEQERYFAEKEQGEDK